MALAHAALLQALTQKNKQKNVHAWPVYKADCMCHIVAVKSWSLPALKVKFRPCNFQMLLLDNNERFVL